MTMNEEETEVVKNSKESPIKNGCQLAIKVRMECCQQIRSPFSRAVQSLVEKHGTPILSIGVVSNPHGVAISLKGEVMVTDLGDWGRHCITVLSPSGVKLRSFGTGLHYPSDLAVDHEGNILVVDNGNHCIKKYTAEGKYSTDHYSIGKPFGVAVHPSNNLVYVTCHCSHQVEVLNSDLKLFATIGRRGKGKGQFIYPQGIACDSTGKVYVADCGNHRIQVFTAEGEFLKFFKMRTDFGEVPGGISIDCNDLVYITEWDNHCVSVFTSQDQFVTSFGRIGEGAGEFNRPIGITVDRSGVVYVCDSDNDRVQVF